MDILLSRRIASTSAYAFAEVDRQVALLRSRGIKVIDFGVGDPREPTPAFVIDTLARSARQHAASGYPSYDGSPEFRRACATYLERDFGVQLDPDKEIISTIGSKEAVFHFPLGVIDPGNVVICPSPGYPPYKTGTRFAGGTPYFVPLLPENGFLMDFEGIPADIVERARIIWTNYPNSPSGRCAPRGWLRKLYDWSQKNDIIIAADEGCYIDLYFAEKPASMLEIGRDGVIVFYSLSKRNNMTGYRIGFCAGDQRLVGALKRVKTNIDSGVPLFVQEAASAALEDENQVHQLRTGYRRKMDVITCALQRIHLPACASEATFYLWQRAPKGMTGLGLAEKLLEAGIVVTPGEWLSDETAQGLNPGREYMRFALVPTLDEIQEAAERIARLKI
jgi:LL-diaminopimelate aminotransferase